MRIIYKEEGRGASFPTYKVHGIATEMTQASPTGLFNKGPLKFHL